ncbi:hypothetical protein Goshw_027911 [Gossypium schwendimanii]|uniref:Uncharacterized protein n=1 Tax=Gossypium schwendimanii TaxID=34291 RepID=A0A7J9LCL6_GOSSC|nr:hypothetical protein [Gossypium schwendimanii]
MIGGGANESITMSLDRVKKILGR